MPLLESQINEANWVTKDAKQLGLGPTLYLFTMKALAYMFLVFAILSLPLMIFYSNGLGPQANLIPKSGRFTDLLARVSLGNIGVSDYACGRVNLA